MPPAIETVGVGAISITQVNWNYAMFKAVPVILLIPHCLRLQLRHQGSGVVVYGLLQCSAYPTRLIL